MLIALSIAGFQFSDSPQQKLTGETMGTTYSIVIAAGENQTGPLLQSNIDARLDQINERMSTWRDDSELSRFNASRSTDWFPVSDETVFVVTEALRVSKMSDGAFDPTVGPLVRLWSFGNSDRAHAVPSDDEIESTLQAVGWKKLEVRSDPPALRKSIGELELDLSAIAKGYAVDAVSEMLNDKGYRNHLVEIGGETKALGLKSDGSDWRIGIEAPDSLPRSLYEAVPLVDSAMATSGDYRNWFEIDGRKYSHTIDPQTGRPVTHRLASVSIVEGPTKLKGAGWCMTADALATAINVLGPERGLEFAEEHLIAALFLVRKNDGFDRVATRMFSQNVGDDGLQSADESSLFFPTAIAAAVIFGLAVIGMAAGVLLSNRCIQGSCGGLANMPGGDGKSACELCTVRTESCDVSGQGAVVSTAGSPNATGDHTELDSDDDV